MIFDGVGAQPFEFQFARIRAVLFSNNVVFSKSNERTYIYAEGQLQMQNAGNMDVSIIDVQGKFEPAAGQFSGEYKYVRPDSIAEEKWIRFSGDLSELHAARPGWIGTGTPNR